MLRPSVLKKKLWQRSDHEPAMTALTKKLVNRIWLRLWKDLALAGFAFLRVIQPILFFMDGRLGMDHWLTLPIYLFWRINYRFLVIMHSEKIIEWTPFDD